MIKGQLIINKQDAYTTWGITMDSSALSTLMTPAGNKSYIENDSRLENGKTLLTSYTKTNEDGSTEEVNMVKKDARDVTIAFNLTAPSEEKFLQRYYSFCEELDKGDLDISTSFLPNVVFHMKYVSCTQFSEFMLGMAKFSLKMTEPNPKNRT